MDAMEHFTESNPQGRLIEASEVASAVSWLCGDGTASVTGQAIAIDGRHRLTRGTATQATSLAGYEARHFLWECEASIATITLNRPERKNPLTFDSYAELRDLFRNLVYASDVDVVVINGAGGNFCSGGDVHDIIGPLTEMNMKELLTFTRMTQTSSRRCRAYPHR